MTENVVVRRARPEDAEGFVRAYEVAWDAALAPIVGKSLGELASFEARIGQFRAGIAAASDRAQAWIAEDAGEILGVAVVVRQRPASVELRDLYVVPVAWGSGVAAKLMDAALGGVGSGAKEAALWVGEANARARRFYQREGWVADGTSRVSSLGPPEVRYRLSLAS